MVAYTDITPAMVDAAIAANMDGVGFDSLAIIMKCRAATLTRLIQKDARYATYERLTMSNESRRLAAERHAPSLEQAANAGGKGCQGAGSHTVDITPSMVMAAAAATREGVGFIAIARILGVGSHRLIAAFERYGQPIGYRGPKLSAAATQDAVDIHEPLLRAASAGDAGDVVDHDCGDVYEPMAPELGIRVHVRPDGISVPYLPSLYDEARA